MLSRRHRITPLASFVAVTLSLHVAWGDEDQTFFKSQLGLLVEYFEVEHAALPPLLREYQLAPDATGLLAKIQALHANRGARLVESSYAVTTPEQTAKIRSVREFTYPSDYFHAEIPQDLTGPIDPTVKITIPATPKDYDTRFIGNLLEFKPIPRPDSERFELEHSSEISRFVEFRTWGQGDSQTLLPYFHRDQSDAPLQLKPGRSALLGTFASASGDPAKRVLGFATLVKMSAASAGEFSDFLKSPPTKAQIKKRNEDAIPETDPFDALDEDRIPEANLVSMITEYIEVDAGTAGEMIRKLNTISDATAARRQLDKSIAEGTAQLLDIRTSLSELGERTETASVREICHPTIYADGNPRRPSSSTPATLAGPLGSAVNVRTPGFPGIFERHHSGIRIEMVAHTSIHRLIGLELKLVNDQLAGELDFGKGEFREQRPLFEQMETSANVYIPDGTSLLLCMHSLETARAGEITPAAERQAARDRRVLVFLTAKIKTIK